MKKYQDKRRRAAAILALILALALALSLAAPIFYAMRADAAPLLPNAAAAVVQEVEALPQVQTTADTIQNTIQGMFDFRHKKKQEIGQEKFSLDMSIGFDQKYILEQSTPMRGVLTNRMNQEFKGEIQIKVYAYEGSEGEGDIYSIYYQPVELAAGAVKQIDMNVNLDSIRHFIEVTLVDDNGNTVFLKNINVEALDPATIMVGVLTENPAELQYLSALQMPSEYEDYTGDYSETVYLNGVTFPKNADVMNNFKLIIIDNFDTKSLTPEQINALKQWIDEGGMLSLGTGPQADKVLGGLANIIDFKWNDAVVQLPNFPSLGDMFPMDSTGQYGSVALAEISAENMSELFEENGHPLFSQVKQGDGTVIVQHFALSLSPVSELPQMVDLLKTVYTFVNPQRFVLDYADSYQYDDLNLSHIASRFPSMKTGSIYIIFIVVGIYIFVIGPVLYFILKRKDKREMGWVIIPALAVVVTGIVFFLGQNSYYKNGIISSVASAELSDDSSVARLAVSSACTAPQKGDVMFTADKNINIVQNQNDYWRYQNSRKLDFCLQKVLSGTNETAITFSNNQRWASNHWSSELTKDLGGRLESNLTITGGRCTGQITNNTNFDFFDVVIGIGSEYTKYDKLPAGESLNIDSDLGNQDNKAYPTVVSKEFYHNYNGSQDMDDMIRKKELTYDEAYHLHQEGDLLENRLERRPTDTMKQGISIQFYGFNEDSIYDSNLKLNGKKAVEKDLTLYHAEFEVNLAGVEAFDIPYGIFYPVFTDSSKSVDLRYYDAWQYYAQNQEELEVQFEVPEGVHLDLFQMRRNTDDANYYEAPQILNTASGQWEPLTDLEYENTADYVSQDGKITVKLFVKAETEISLPDIRWKGAGLQYAGN